MFYHKRFVFFKFYSNLKIGIIFASNPFGSFFSLCEICYKEFGENKQWPLVFQGVLRSSKDLDLFDEKFREAYTKRRVDYFEEDDTDDGTT